MTRKSTIILKMHSFLISHGDFEQRRKEALVLAAELLQTSAIEKETPDLLILTTAGKPSIGIEAVRTIKEFFKNKPLLAKNHGVIILESQFLTFEAQNALLKTLEEPPAHSFLILTVAHPNLLLATVVSRCVLKTIDESETKSSLKEDENLLALIKGSYKQRLDFFEENSATFSHKEESLQKIDSWLVFLHEKSKKKVANFKRWQSLFKALLKTKKDLLSSSASARNLLEITFLKLPEGLKIP